MEITPLTEWYGKAIARVGFKRFTTTLGIPIADSDSARTENLFPIAQCQVNPAWFLQVRIAFASESFA
jgi:hypothetical protein